VVAASTEGAEQGAGAEEQYFSRGEAARRLGVPPRTIQQWAKDGKIPCVRTFGGHRRFAARDLDSLGELVKEQRQRRRAPRAST
jgi:excisionase family DNA binding protein